MKTSTLGLFLVVGTALVTGCQSAGTMSHPTTAAAKPAPTATMSAAQQVSGDYHLTTTLDNVPAPAAAVGSAWVSVRPDNAEHIHIQVRASHTSQQSCHFDGKASLLGQDAAHGIIFQTVASNTKTFLQFKDGKLMIDGQDRYALANLCTGGATVAGNYQKLIATTAPRLS